MWAKYKETNEQMPKQIFKQMFLIFAKNKDNPVDQGETFESTPIRPDSRYLTANTPLMTVYFDTEGANMGRPLWVAISNADSYIHEPEEVEATNSDTKSDNECTKINIADNR